MRDALAQKADDSDEGNSSQILSGFQAVSIKSLPGAQLFKNYNYDQLLAIDETLERIQSILNDIVRLNQQRKPSLFNFSARNQTYRNFVAKTKNLQIALDTHRQALVYLKYNKLISYIDGSLSRQQEESLKEVYQSITYWLASPKPVAFGLETIKSWFFKPPKKPYFYNDKVNELLGTFRLASIPVGSVIPTLPVTGLSSPKILQSIFQSVRNSVNSLKLTSNKDARVHEAVDSVITYVANMLARNARKDKLDYPSDLSHKEALIKGIIEKGLKPLFKAMKSQDKAVEKAYADASAEVVKLYEHYMANFSTFDAQEHERYKAVLLAIVKAEINLQGLTYQTIAAGVQVKNKEHENDRKGIQQVAMFFKPLVSFVRAIHRKGAGHETCTKSVQKMNSDACTAVASLITALRKKGKGQDLNADLDSVLTGLFHDGIAVVHKNVDEALSNITSLEIEKIHEDKTVFLKFACNIYLTIILSNYYCILKYGDEQQIALAEEKIFNELLPGLQKLYQQVYMEKTKALTRPQRILLGGDSNNHRGKAPWSLSKKGSSATAYQRLDDTEFERHTLRLGRTNATNLQ